MTCTSRTFGGMQAIARGKTTKTRSYGVRPRTAGYEVILDGGMLENAAQCAAEAVEHASAPPIGAGVKDVSNQLKVGTQSSSQNVGNQNGMTGVGKNDKPRA